MSNRGQPPQISRDPATAMAGDDFLDAEGDTVPGAGAGSSNVAAESDGNTSSGGGAACADTTPIDPNKCACPKCLERRKPKQITCVGHTTVGNALVENCKLTPRVFEAS